MIYHFYYIYTVYILVIYLYYYVCKFYKYIYIYKCRVQSIGRSYSRLSEPVSKPREMNRWTFPFPPPSLSPPPLLQPPPPVHSTPDSRYGATLLNGKVRFHGTGPFTWSLSRWRDDTSRHRQAGGGMGRGGGGGKGEGYGEVRHYRGITSVWCIEPTTTSGGP